MPKSKIPTVRPGAPARKTHSDPDTTANSSELDAPPPPASSSSKPCSIPKPRVTKDRSLPSKRTPENAMTMAALENSLCMEQFKIPEGLEPFNLTEENHNEVPPPKEEKQPQVDQEHFVHSRKAAPVQHKEKDSRTVKPLPMMTHIDPESTAISKITPSAPKKGPVRSPVVDVKVDSVADIIINCSQKTVDRPINLLENKTIMTIFAYLNLSDLRMCRGVQPHWNALISQDESFLDGTLFVAQISKCYEECTNQVIYHDATSGVQLPFRHCRFQHMDSEFRKRPLDFVFRNSDNEKYTPALQFFQSLRSIEFRDCFLIWKTIKAYLIRAPQVTSLKISSCLISGFVPASPSQTVNEFDEFKAGSAISGVKSLEIYETISLDSITSILRKFNEYSNQALETLKISYHPPENRQEDLIFNYHPNTVEEDLAAAKDFCRELKSIVNFCKNSLRVLNLDVQDDLTLDVLGAELTKDLANLGARLNLEEFQLSPRLDCWLSTPKLAPKSPAAMTMKSLDDNITDAESKVKHAAAFLAWFLESQRELKTLGLPFMGHPDSGSFFRSVLQGLPCAAKLKFLAVPSISFLPGDLFHAFPKLKRVKIGDPSGIKSVERWSLLHYYTRDVPKRDVQNPFGQTWRCTEADVDSRKLSPNASGISSTVANPNIRKLATTEQLSIFSAVLPSNFDVAMMNMGNLTSLEINSGFETPLIHDKELQLVIGNLKKLRSLVISCADKLTDYGLTGIPEKNCKLMFQNRSYCTNGVNPHIWTSKKVPGRPLSDLKDLRKLVLIGDCSITDIGVGYGVAFGELKYCYLPYSDHITDWGIETLCKSNPSLESLTFTGLHQYSKKAFESATKSHPRMKSGDVFRCRFYMERKSPFWDSMMMGLPTPGDLLEAVASIGGGIKTVVSFLASPLTMEFYR